MTDDVAKPAWTPGRMAFQLDPTREAYLLANSSGYDANGAALAHETEMLGEPAVMMLGKEQYGLLKFLARDSRLTLDLGTFTGLSALALARAAAHGRVITVDRSTEWTSIAERHWSAAGVRERIETRFEEADQVLMDLATSGERVDFVFIDLDKAGLPRYAARALEILSPRGVLAVDNTFWHGWIFDDSRTDPDTQGVRQFNAWVANEPTLESVVLPIADGMTLVHRTV